MVLKKEKQVIHLVDTHLSKMSVWIRTAADTIELYLNDKIVEAEARAQEMKHLEAEAENILYDIWDMLYKGAYLPIIREEIYTILKNIGRVAYAAEGCTDLFLYHKPQIPEDLRDPYNRLVKESFKLFQPVRKSILGYLRRDDVIDVIRAEFKHVSSIKAEVDQTVLGLKHQIFSCALEPCHKIQLNSCMESITEVSDLAWETAGDMQRIAVKLVA